MTEMCACGRPLHYTDPENYRRVQKLVDDLGPNIRVTTPSGTWVVPRHYIALHGIKAVEIRQLARKHGWLKL